MSLREPEGRLRWISRAEADVLISWDRVDLKSNVLGLEGRDTKSGRRRAVPAETEEARRR